MTDREIALVLISIFTGVWVASASMAYAWLCGYTR